MEILIGYLFVGSVFALAYPYPSPYRFNPLNFTIITVGWLPLGLWLLGLKAMR